MDRVHKSLTTFEKKELRNPPENRNAIESGTKIDSSLLKTSISS